MVTRSYTTIERVFFLEFGCLRLFAGFLFDWPKPIALIYRLVVLLVSRYKLTTHYAKYLPVIETYPKSTQQNIKVFLGFYAFAGYLASILALYTSFKYHKLLLILLRKRFDRQYLSTNHDLRDYKTETSSISTNSSEKERQKPEQSSNRWKKTNIELFPRPKVQYYRRARIILLLNLTFNSITSYLRYRAYAMYLSQAKIPSQRNLRLVDIYPPLVFRDYALSHETYERPVIQVDSNNGLYNLIIMLWSSTCRLLQSPWFKREFSAFVSELHHMFWDIITSIMHICQTYGSLIIVLMIVSVMTDMLRFSIKYDELVPDESVTNPSKQGSKFSPTNSSRIDLEDDIVSQDGTNKSFLLSTRLLIQIREVLIMIRCLLSTEYLVLLVGDFARIMTIFCMLIDSVNRSQLLPVAINILEFGRIIYTMTMTRLGHLWLNGEVNRLRRLLDQNFLMREGELVTLPLAKIHKINKGERITLYRLAEDIESIWPTDWYSLDFKTFMKHNIILITFVATLQQLVEAGSRVNYLGYNSTNILINGTTNKWIPKNWNETLRIWLGS